MLPHWRLWKQLAALRSEAHIREHCECKGIDNAKQPDYDAFKVPTITVSLAPTHCLRNA